jgi:hypothetical protein
MGKDKKEIRKPEIVCIAVISTPLTFSVLLFGGHLFALYKWALT